MRKNKNKKSSLFPHEESIHGCSGKSLAFYVNTGKLTRQIHFQTNSQIHVRAESWVGGEIMELTQLATIHSFTHVLTSPVPSSQHRRQLKASGSPVPST